MGHNILHPKFNYIKEYFLNEKRKGIEGKIEHTLEEWYYLITFPLREKTPKTNYITKKQFRGDLLDYDSWFGLDKEVIHITPFISAEPKIWIFTANL